MVFSYLATPYFVGLHYLASFWKNVGYRYLATEICS
jgi:hypothetical protein